VGQDPANQPGDSFLAARDFVKASGHDNNRASEAASVRHWRKDTNYARLVNAVIAPAATNKFYRLISP
jgi:hypothetical protein